MPTKSIPTIGDPNWGTPLNAHLSQLQNPTNGGINTFEQFSGRPTNLTLDDKGKTYLYTQTGNLHQWTGTTWKVLNESVINVKDYGVIGDCNSTTNTGTDDSNAIQKVINDFNGATFFPKGNYLVTKQINLNTDTTSTSAWNAPKILGAGQIATKFFSKVVNGSLFDFRQNNAVQYFQGGYGLEFRDFSIFGTGTGVNSDGISISGAIYPVISGVKIRQISGHGFAFPFDINAPVEGIAPYLFINADAFSCFTAKIEGCAAELCGKWGFYVDTGNTAVAMTNCYASSCAIGGLYLQGGGSSVSDSSFSYCGTLGDPKSCGLQVGDDYQVNKTGLLKNSYPQIFNCYFKNIELDSNYNRNLVATGYNHEFKSIRLIQGSLPTPGTAWNSPIFAQLGMANSPLLDSTFINTVVRTNDPVKTGKIFSDNYLPAGGGGFCYNIRFNTIRRINISNNVIFYDFNNNSQNLVSEEVVGKISYSQPSAIPAFGTWEAGDKVFNSNLTPGSYTGWVCTTAGTPGTWKGFGQIEV
jgi:Pectate lyase superfamily protein